MNQKLQKRKYKHELAIPEHKAIRIVILKKLPLSYLTLQNENGQSEFVNTPPTNDPTIQNKRPKRR